MEQQVKWHVSNVRGVINEVARLVTVIANFNTPEFADHAALDGYGVRCEFGVWVPLSVTDWDSIEQEAYARLRRDLPMLANSVPNGHA